MILHQTGQLKLLTTIFNHIYYKKCGESVICRKKGCIHANYSRFFPNGGAYGIRTRDLIAASDARFQLR